jgi:hypothetical protein
MAPIPRIQDRLGGDRRVTEERGRCLPTGSPAGSHPSSVGTRPSDGRARVLPGPRWRGMPALARSRGAVREASAAARAARRSMARPVTAGLRRRFGLRHLEPTAQMTMTEDPQGHSESASSGRRCGDPGALSAGLPDSRRSGRRCGPFRAGRHPGARRARSATGMRTAARRRLAKLCRCLWRPSERRVRADRPAPCPRAAGVRRANQRFKDDASLLLPADAGMRSALRPTSSRAPTLHPATLARGIIRARAARSFRQAERGPRFPQCRPGAGAKGPLSVR